MLKTNFWPARNQLKEFTQSFPEMSLTGLNQSRYLKTRIADRPGFNQLLPGLPC